jgi:MFS family permease
MPAAVMPLTGVPIMLPAIANDLGTSASATAWVALGLFLSLAGFFLPGSHIGNLLGHRKIGLVGAYGEVLVLALIVFSPNLGVIVALRIIEGVVRSLAMPNLQAMAIGKFAQEERGRALGILFVGGSIGFLAAAPIAGIITDLLGWRWVFGMSSVSMLILTTLLAASVTDEDSRPRAWPGFKVLDLPGSFLMVIGVGAFLLGARGSSLQSIVILVSAGFAILTLLVLHEKRQAEPMLPILFLRNRTFLFTNWMNALFNFTDGVALYLLPIYFIEGLGWSASYAGAVIIGFTIARPVASAIGGFLTDRFGVISITIVSVIAVAGGTIGIAFSGPSAFLWVLLPSMLIAGLGNGLFTLSNAKQSYGAMPEEYLATAPGSLGLGRHLSRAVGVGAAAGVFAIFAGDTNAGPDVLSSAFRIIMLASSVLFTAGCAGAILISLSFIRRSPS